MPSTEDSLEVLVGEAEWVRGYDHWLIGYSHFDLSSTRVRVHDPWILPPPIREGDQVAVAGVNRRGELRAWACRRLDEPEEGSRRLQLRLRRLVWGAFQAMVPLSFIVFLILSTGPPLWLRGSYALSAAFFIHGLLWHRRHMAQAAEARLARELLDLRAFD